MKTYKLVMLGESMVGKTCIINRYIKKTYSEHNEASVAGSFFSDIVTIKPEGVSAPVKVKLQIWDTAGSEQFRSLAGIYYKGVNAVCLVYDSTSQKTFEGLNYWVNELEEKCDEKVLLGVVASKVDLSHCEEVSIKQASEYAKKLKAQFYQTSSKEGTGIQSLFVDLAERLYMQSL